MSSPGQFCVSPDIFDSLPEPGASYTEADAVISSSAEDRNFSHVAAASDITGDGQTNLLITSNRFTELSESMPGDPLYVASFTDRADQVP